MAYTTAIDRQSGSDPAEILLVENDQLQQQICSEQLIHAGYRLTPARSGAEALECLELAHYDLVILGMPVQGIPLSDLLVRIKSYSPAIDVLIMADHTDFETMPSAQKQGVCRCLIKPVNREELLYAVQHCHEQRRLIDENTRLSTLVGLLQTSLALLNSIDLESVCHQVVDVITREVGVERGVCFVLNDDDINVCCQKGIPEFLNEPLRTVLMQFFHKQYSRVGQPYKVLIPSGEQLLEAHDLKEAVLFPLSVRNCRNGTIVLFNDSERPIPAIRSEADLAFLLEHGARALDNALRFSSARDMLYIDELSGLFNYRYLKIALEREVKRADRYSTPLSVVFIDLDNFKQVNDIHGHLIGSSLLKEVGGLLKHAVRDVDVVIRYGGDEYTVILLETDALTACAVAERLRSVIAKYQFMVADGCHVQLTASLGVASYPDDTVGTVELLAMADKAMYASKVAGKNRVYRVCQMHNSVKES